MSNQKPRVEIDEDVDDLDDVLEQFNTPAPAPASQPTASASTSKSESAPPPTDPKTPQPNPLDDVDEDFAKELERGMEMLMREMAATTPAMGEDEEKAKAMKAAWEAMMIDGMDEAMGMKKDEEGEAQAPPNTAADPSGVDDAFQRSIRQAMEKLEESEESLQADATSGNADSLEALLQQLNGALGEGEGEGEADGQLQGLLESMMGQLMSKEVLYDPLKELHEKFPSYLSENASTLSADDKTRYQSQFESVTKIIAIFEDPKYSDENAEKSAEVVTLMNEMQSHGSPPAEIMGPLPPGFDFGPDGLPKVPDNCVIS